MRAALCLAALIVGTLNAQAAMPVVQHSIQAEIDPGSHFLKASDTLLFPDGMSGPVNIYLNRHLSLSIKQQGTWHPLEAKGSDARLNVFEVSVNPGMPVELRYEGVISDALKQAENEIREFEQTSGIIDAQGVFLSGNSAWYPVIPDTLISFDLTVGLPLGWKSVSQGKRLVSDVQNGKSVDRWAESLPQDEIYCIAGSFVEYKEPGTPQRMVFLRDKDDALASHYLELAKKYIDQYSDMLGKYPFAKFALVENFWQSGYGMPSFTLIGSKVIRLPFIPYTSYPHEIVHNWWGNGVYVDYAKGNWSEGLTAYLADHGIREKRGKGALYRRGILQKYTHFVDAENDFPLAKFMGRDSPASEAIGYGKTLMLFHMIRNRVGDAAFVQGLQQVYTRKQFQTASFGDFAQAFSAVGSVDFRSMVRQWTQQTGAPEIRLASAALDMVDEGYQVNIELIQAQPGEVFVMDVPIAITLQGEDESQIRWLHMDEKRAKAEWVFDREPLRVDVDPEFDVFRRLSDQEIPPSFSGLFGSRSIQVLMPEHGADADAYDAVTQTLESQGLMVSVSSDADGFPVEGNVLLLGWGNRHLGVLQGALSSQQMNVSGERIMLGQQRFSAGGHAAGLAAFDMERGRGVYWLAVENQNQTPALMRKLPHYGKYGYAVFAGDHVENKAKGEWNVDSPELSKVFGSDAVGRASWTRTPLLGEKESGH